MLHTFSVCHSDSYCYVDEPSLSYHDDYFAIHPRAPIMRAYLPAVGVGVFIITLITCEALAARSSYWSGDLPLPYISDTGRDGANYACFATGGTISALLLLLQMVWLNPGYAHAVKREQTSTSGWYCPWLTGSILSTPALVGLILLCVFNTNDYESLHACKRNPSHTQVQLSSSRSPFASCSSAILS